jgi:xanthine phosphoribosyltransferase
LAARFAHHTPDRVLTAEISGIAPALLEVGVASRVPMIFARKIKSVTMPEDSYERTVPSRTKGDMLQLMVAPNFLDKGYRVLIIDDFLASGQTIEALDSIVKESGAELVRIGTVIEKAFEEGRKRLAPLKVPIESMEDDRMVIR